MFTLERQQKIQEIVKDKSSIKVNELSALLGVSESTIRRDLQEMEVRGLLTRTHGGAVDTTRLNYEMSFKEKEVERHEQKQQIAEIGAEMIHDGETIILDSGTTTLEIARRLTAENITVITNSIDIAIELSQKENIELIVTGGSLRSNTRAMVGFIPENTLSNFRVDKAFIGANAISLKEGVTTPNLMEAQTKRAMMNVANQVIFVADSSKFNKVCFSVICGLDETCTIITSSDINKEIVRPFEEIGIKVITK